GLRERTPSPADSGSNSAGFLLPKKIAGDYLPASDSRPCQYRFLMSLKRATGTTMRAAALDRFGGVETIQMKTLPVPELGPDEVLLRVEAAGVGVWDPYEREGEFAKMFGQKPRFPYVLGSDGAGTVAAVGEQVRHLKEGDRAYALALTNPKGGFYAEYAAVKADNVSPLPKKLSVEQAGVMPSDALTALRGWDEILKLKQGDSLMV